MGGRTRFVIARSRAFPYALSIPYRSKSAWFFHFFFIPIVRGNNHKILRTFVLFFFLVHRFRFFIIYGYSARRLQPPTSNVAPVLRSLLHSRPTERRPLFSNSPERPRTDRADGLPAKVYRPVYFIFWAADRFIIFEYNVLGFEKNICES